ncbi:MAG: serine/threonine protein kinase [Myxococcales bacterium]|nr:serine/threonine protein kinase [Myxococcales bacterium]
MATPPSQPPTAAPAALPATPKLWSGVAVGDVLDKRFKIVAPISSGGTATVYRCEDLHLRAPAAVKILTEVTEDARLRFLDEGRILANLKSPHLVQVLAVGEVSPPVNSGRPAVLFMALELLPGRNLDQRLREEGPLRWREAAELLVQVAGALADMHQVGVIHRDIKPGNIVEIGSITRRRLIKIVDLGIAKVMDWTAVDTTGLTPSPRHQTEANLVVGTPGFIAPEARVVPSPPATPRFDTFALGVTLYLLCTGVMPKLAELRPMNEVYPKCEAPLELEALVASALAVLPEDRIATAEEFGHRLESIRAAYADESEPYLFAGCFELLQALGAGAKGEVYKAYNHDAPSRVALKLLSEKSKQNPEERARFAREAQVLSAVRHPALPEFHECRTSEKERRPYIAMALMPGRCAGEFCVGKNILPPAEVIDVGKSLASALVALHARGIIHRDISTTNVLIDRTPKLTTAMLIDFGMAELEPKFYDQRDPPRPRDRIQLGTGGLEQFDWTAPEAKATHVWTGKSDVWSVGLLLYRLLTGKRPTTNKAGELISPREVQPRCSRALASALLSALNPNPDERVDAAEMLGRLHAAADELAEETADVADELDESVPSAATPELTAAKPATPTSPSSRRARAWAWARLGLEALAAAALIVLVLREGDGAVSAGPLAPPSTQAAVVAPSPPPSSVTQAAVADPTASPPRPSKDELLVSSDARKPMREALAGAAEELRHCSDLAGGILVVQFTTVEHGDKFADVAIHSRTSPAVDRCVGDATAGIRFEPLAQPQRFTEEYP